MSAAPCPFCGGLQSIATLVSSMHALRCMDCGATGPAAGTKENAAQRWNERGRFRKGDPVLVAGTRYTVHAGPRVTYEVAGEGFAFDARQEEMVSARYPYAR